MPSIRSQHRSACTSRRLLWIAAATTSAIVNTACERRAPAPPKPPSPAEVVAANNKATLTRVRDQLRAQADTLWSWDQRVRAISLSDPSNSVQPHGNPIQTISVSGGGKHSYGTSLHLSQPVSADHARLLQTMDLISDVLRRIPDASRGEPQPLTPDLQRAADRALEASAAWIKRIEANYAATKSKIMLEKPRLTSSDAEAARRVLDEQRGTLYQMEIEYRASTLKNAATSEPKNPVAPPDNTLSRAGSVPVDAYHQQLLRVMDLISESTPYLSEKEIAPMRRESLELVVAVSQRWIDETRKRIGLD